MAQAIAGSGDPRDWYAQLTAHLARLTQAQIVSVLHFEPAQNLLVSQPPFYGLPDIVSVLYQILIPSGSAVEQLWQSNQPWFSNVADMDADIDATGLRQVADAVGIHTSLLVPISVGGRKVGAIHLCNKAQGRSLFTERDGRLVQHFAGQIGAILDNVRLMGDARARAAQAEGLRGVATALASSTDQDEILRTAMQQSAALFHFDVGVISLLDEASGELAPHPASLYGLTPEKAQVVRLAVTDADYAVSVTRQRRLIWVGSMQRDQVSATDQPLSTVYRTALEQFKLESAMAAPLIVSDRCLGELLVGARREEAFARSDLELLATLAAQLASGLERARLYASTDQKLQHRVEQLTALTRVSREINQSLALEHLLDLVLDEVKHLTRADCGSIVLLAGPRQVERRVGEPELGPQLTALEADLATAAAASEPGLIGPRRVANLTAPSPLAAHPDQHSALLVPIWAGGALTGLIHLHSRQAAGFDEAAEEIVSTLAAQTAIAITNAQRADEQQKRTRLLSRRADQLAQLLQISRSVRSDLPLATNLEIIGDV
jgi:GAF domain-containing protein